MDNVQGIEDEIRGGILFPFDLTFVPFVVKRIFWITDVPDNSIRGGHAHKFCQQFYICIKGAVEVTIKKAMNGFGNSVRQVMMVKGSILFIDKLVWTSERFITEDGIFLVLCSHSYNKDDYICDIKELKEYVKDG